MAKVSVILQVLPTLEIGEVKNGMLETKDTET